MKTIKQKCNATLKKIAWLYLVLLLSSTSHFARRIILTNYLQTTKRNGGFL